MNTAEPLRRSELAADVHRILGERSAPGDRETLLTFASIVLPEIPDSMMLRLSPAAMAARLTGYFNFATRTIPPEHQLYRGLPGLHVVVRNPDDDEEAATRGISGPSHEVTIVETHTPDAPFIFESLKNFFQREGLRVFSAIHPIFTVRRQWERIVWIGGPTDDGSRELYCQFRIERVEARERLRRLEHQIHSLLKAVFLAVEDFHAMTGAMRESLQRIRPRHPEQSAEAYKAFLQWLLDDNYVHLGMLRYLAGPTGELDADQDGALGVFKDPSLLPTVFPGLNERISSHLQVPVEDDRIVDMDYCTNVVAIHHLEPIDDIVIREWTADGRLACLTHVLGRLAKGAFAARAQDIPLLKEKLAWLLEKSGALPNSHSYREIRATFNHMPKRELFYSDAPSLKHLIEPMVEMTSDDEIVVTLRFGRGDQLVAIAFSDLRYSRRGEEDLKRSLAEQFGPISFNTWADCGTSGVLIYYFDQATLEHPIDTEKVRELTRRVITTWEDQVAQVLEREFGAIDGRRLFNKYIRTETRSGIYRESTKPDEVPDDLRRLELLEARLEMSVTAVSAESALLKLYSPRPLGLTDTLRTLQNLGLQVVEELNIPLTLPDQRKGHLERLRVEADPAVIEAMTVAEESRLLDAARALQEERATDCPLNGLILRQGLTWREVEVLRTFRNHLLQVRPYYNADTINGVLLRNSAVARAIFDDFASRFDPAQAEPRDGAVHAADVKFRRALQKVASLVDDEILRGLENLVRSTIRTNFYQHPERPVISIKVDSSKVEGMMSPRPMFEIYVHSRKLEGIHLRGGKVARGGIRWSDRHDDFRTEVLGLMKTQMVKNAIIVPVGSKGGFVLKGTVPPRPALDTYLIDRYRQFISGLLDVTDNLVDGKVVHPPEVVRCDGDDPYLVVAADKGTAHLSDTANSVSNQYGFWLGDAFASGGSVGYDHKREGITARGAWECIRHNFQLLGHDVQTQPFTMAGIGDMSGDVFGNGALRSRVIRLVAAFDHRHIFLDPNPDPERTFAERQRLFALPRSSWRDYDTTLISAGGGVFDRTTKSIPLSAEVRAILDLEQEEASGEQVIKAILKAKVDLLYNGGIGTYIKASSEDDADVGDRANDRVRVDATDVRARVIGEGGNLGLTQRGRIEYWQQGGLVNTDAVDNSGGVDMSDHEVNIKILLDLLVRNGVIANRNNRNRLLLEMTDEVSDLVLQDNNNQARALSLDGIRSTAAYDEHLAFVGELIAAGIVNRQDDALPTRDELRSSAARDRGLPRPVLAVLMGHTKNWARREVLRTDVPDSEAAQPFLTRYFPQRLQNDYSKHFHLHPLRREIIATGVANYLVNHAGVACIHRLMKAASADIGQVVGAWLEADHEANGGEARESIRAQALPLAEELAALVEVEKGIEAKARAGLEGKGASRQPAAAGGRGKSR